MRDNPEDYRTRGGQPQAATAGELITAKNAKNRDGKTAKTIPVLGQLRG
jgi:hypothetical protein